MSEKTDDTIRIVTDDAPQLLAPDGSKIGIDRGGHWDVEVQPEAPAKKVAEVKVEKLEQEMASFLQVVDRLFSRAEQKKSEMQLDEIELSVEINGEGQVSLLGTGAKTGGKGAIKLKFKRAEPK